MNIKKSGLIFFLTIFTILLTGCFFSNDKNSNNSVAEKEKYIEKFSDKSEFSEVISPRDAVNGVLNEAFTIYYDEVKKALINNPALKDADIKDVVLVEDTSSIFKDTRPYYYVVNCKMPNGNVIAEAKVFAMNNDKAVGKVAQTIVSSSQTVSYKTLTSNEAIDIIKLKYNIDSKDIQTKAVLISDDLYQSPFDWAWAIKPSKTTKCSSVEGQSVNAVVFLVNATSYNSKDVVAKNSVGWVSKIPKITALETDIFNKKTNKALSKSIVNNAITETKKNILEYLY